MVSNIAISIWPIDGILTGTTTLGQNGLGSNGNEGVFHIPLSSRTAICSLEGESYLPSYRNSPKSEQIENAPEAILISTKQFNSMLVLGSSGEYVHRFMAFLSTVLFAHWPPSLTWDPIKASSQIIPRILVLFDS